VFSFLQAYLSKRFKCSSTCASSPIYILIILVFNDYQPTTSALSMSTDTSQYPRRSKLLLATTMCTKYTGHGHCQKCIMSTDGCFHYVTTVKVNSTYAVNLKPAEQRSFTMHSFIHSPSMISFFAVISKSGYFMENKTRNCTHQHSSAPLLQSRANNLRNIS
jgi:hypothetical protein